jgi:hypothetical protein
MLKPITTTIENCADKFLRQAWIAVGASASGRYPWFRFPPKTDIR